MNNFRPQFTKIKGLSERRRLPRQGKIRLGIKVRNKAGRTDKCQHEEGELCIYCSHPKETDYFVVPQEVAEVYGDHPKELEIMLPVNDPEVVFPQKLAWYGSSKGPKCVGDGESAIRLNDEGEWEQRECPCELYEKECMRRANLMVLLPKVSLSGVYQIDIGSYHSIVDINSGIDYTTGLIGRFSMVPMILKRVPRDTHANGQKQVHYTLTLTPDVTPEMLVKLRENTQRVLMGPQYALPAPEDVNPVYDEGPGVVIKDEEDVIDVSPKPPPTGSLNGKPNGKTLEMGSPLHKQIEALISEEEFDRILFHEYLLQKGKIELNETGKPSFSTMSDEFARKLVNRWDKIKEIFEIWLEKQDKDAQE